MQPVTIVSNAVVITDPIMGTLCVLLILCVIFLVIKLMHAEQRVAEIQEYAQRELALKDQQVRGLQTMNRAGVVEIGAYLYDDRRN